MKYVILMMLFLISNTILCETLSIKENRLYLWNKHKIQFGTFDMKLFDNISLKKEGNKYTVESDKMYTLSGEEKDIKLKVDFIEDENEKIHVKFKVEFHEKVEIKYGFGIFIFNIVSNSYEITNHAISETLTKEYIEGYNNIYFKNELNLNFFNPLKQHMKFSSKKDYILLEAIPHMKVRYQIQQEKQDDIRQIMDKNEVVEFSFTISKEQDYFSPMLSLIPNGHTEASMMMWDEIPLGFEEKTFMTFTTPKKTGGLIHSRMLQILDEVPYYKANFLLTFDYFDGRLKPGHSGGDQLDMSKGKKHYQIEGPFNIANNPPDSFKVWLNAIENNELYPWTPKVSLGFHAWHHTHTENGKVRNLKYHEFGYLDSLETSQTMDKVFSLLDSISITDHSIKTMRFPGIRYQEHTWQEVVARGIKLIDIGHCWDVNDEHNFSKSWGRDNATSWGIKTAFWTDYEDYNTEEIFETYYNTLKNGIPLLMGGHPSETVGSSKKDEFKYDIFKDFLYTIKEKSEDVTFLLPDSLAYFWDDLSTVSVDSVEHLENGKKYNLVGNFPEKMTIVLPEYSPSDSIVVKGCSVLRVKKKRFMNYIVLENFIADSVGNGKSALKTIEVSIINGVKESGKLGVSVCPNPTTERAFIYFECEDSEFIDYTITTLAGLPLSEGRFFLKSDSFLYVNSLLHNYYGIFVVSIVDDKGRKYTESFFRTKM